MQGSWTAERLDDTRYGIVSRRSATVQPGPVIKRALDRDLGFVVRAVVQSDSRMGVRPAIVWRLGVWKPDSVSPTGISHSRVVAPAHVIAQGEFRSVRLLVRILYSVLRISTRRIPLPADVTTRRPAFSFNDQHTALRVEHQEVALALATLVVTTSEPGNVVEHCVRGVEAVP